MSGTPLRHAYRIPDDAIIAIGGTVGVGKSTLTRCLAAALGFRASLEKADNPYLPRFYTDQRRWSFHLQVYFLAERFKEQMHLFQSGGGVVQDRTIYEDAGIFARMLYENGLMAPEDYRTYTLLADAMMMTPYFPHPDVLIYLEGPLPLILDRVARRGRPAERNAPVAYWEELYRRYDEWIRTFRACPVVRVDIRDYDVADTASIERIVARIAPHLRRTPRPSSRSCLT